MKKARQFLGIFLALLLSLSVFPANLARADNFTNEKPITSIRENTNDKEVIEKYSKGITDEPFQVEARKNFATEKGLLGEVDSNYFLNEDYVFSKSLDFLEEEKLAILVNPIGSIQEDISTNGVTFEISNSPSNYSISSDTSERSIRSRRSINNAAERLVVNNPGHFIQYYQGIKNEAPELFVNGKVAFCVNFELITPPTGTIANNKRVSNNLALRKALYYGYGGPAEVKSFTSNRELLMIATTNVASGANGHKTYNIGRHFTAHIANLPAPPDNFVVYIVSTSPGKLQDLAYWEIKQVPKKGKLRIFKGTYNLEVSRKNNYYETIYAHYGVYTDANCTNLIATLITDAKGYSKKVELDPDIYYLKELKAPKGFHIDTRVHNVQVVANTTKEVKVYDTPIDDPIGILIQKLDSRTGQANSSLANAEFTIKFYAGQYDDGVDPATKGIQPTKTWVMRTNNNGFVRMEDSVKVSGDEFYRNPNGKITFPLGTITIQETKSPPGYRINSQLIVRNIKPGGGTGGLANVYQVPTIKEDSVNFSLKKDQLNTGIVLPGVKFRYTNELGQASELTVDDKGEINLYALKQGIHKIVETHSSPGYTINGFEVVFEVTADNKVVLRSDLTNRNMHWEDRNGNGHLVVGNVPKNYSFKITKTNDKGMPLKDAEFTLYSDKDLRNVVATKTTDENGIVTFTDLTPEVKYYAKETNSPPGYRALLEVKEIYATSIPVQDKFSIFVDGVEYTSSTQDGSVTIEGNKENRVAGIKIINEVRMKLPETGSGDMIPLLLIGSFLMLTYLYLDRKLVKKFNREGEVIECEK